MPWFLASLVLLVGLVAIVTGLLLWPTTGRRPRTCGSHGCTCAWGVGRRSCACCGCPTPVRGAPGTL
jgi:hypothetical protein